MTALVKIPRRHTKRRAPIQDFTELNPWISDIDSRIVEILDSLQGFQRVVARITNTTSAASVGVHAPTHLPATGIDALATAAPSSILGGTSSNATGTGDSFARSDHSHDVATAAPSGGYATVAAEGSGNNLMRAAAVLRYPEALATLANLATITASDDGIDTTLTASLGTLKLVSPDNKLHGDWWFSAGGTAPATGTVLNFTASSAILGSSLNFGINGALQFGSADTWSGQKSFARFTFTNNSVSGQVFSSVTERVLELVLSGATISLGGPNTWAERSCLNMSMGGIVGSQAGTHTLTQGFRVTGWPIVGTAGTYVNVVGGRILQPTIGGTIRRALWIETTTSNLGTEAADAEGIYIEDLGRGTANRRSLAAEGATAGAPTAVAILEQVTAHAVGTARRFLVGLNASVLSNPSGVGDTVLSLVQLNTGASAGAHLNFSDKAGAPPSPNVGDVWRNSGGLYYQSMTLTHLLNPISVKGDLITRDSSIENRLPVGADTLFLTADAAQAVGIKWGKINDLTADGAPDAAADYVMTWDASAATHKKVLLNLVAAGAGGDNVSVNGVAVTDADFDDATPAAPDATRYNVEFEQSGASPTNISAHVPEGGTWHTIAEDLGTGRRSGSFTVVHPGGLTSSQTITVQQSSAPIASKGDATDEGEFDQIQAYADFVDATHFKVTWRAPGVVVGTYNFAYSVGA